MLPYLIFNGTVISSSSFSLTPSNRAFRYGDGVFETLFCIGNEPHLFALHYARMLSALSLLRMTTTSFPTATMLQKQIALLVAKNKYIPFSRIRITVFRAEGGLYTPINNTPQWVIEQERLTEEPFSLNQSGLFVGIYTDMPKPASSLSKYKTCSSLHLVLAALKKQEQQWGDILLINEKGKIIEGLSSNIFWIKDGIAFTPMISSGCVDGTMRHHAMGLLKSMAIPVKETPGVTVEELESAEELFLTNSIQGIRWIVGLNSKRYYLKTAKTIASELQNEVKRLTNQL